jgi:hypothetical protein
VAGSAFHLYSGDISALSQVHEAYPEKNICFNVVIVLNESDVIQTFNIRINGKSVTSTLSGGAAGTYFW